MVLWKNILKPGSWGCEADSGRIWKELHKRLVRTQYQQISLIQLSFSFRFLEMLIDFPLSGYGTKYQSSKNTANKIGGHPEPPQPWESEAEPAEERPWYVPIPRASGYRVQSYRSFKFNQVKTPLIRVKSHFCAGEIMWILLQFKRREFLKFIDHMTHAKTPIASCQVERVWWPRQKDQHRRSGPEPQDRIPQIIQSTRTS